MPSIGIDLGTSNSLVCFWNGEESCVIPNQHGNNLTPSVVGVDDNGEILIGEVAKERLITHPDLTAATFKRFMGTEKIYQLGNKAFTPIELSALVLKTLKQSAESYLKESCEEVIISVPAYFNNIQREATIEAAKLAGLQVKQLISEPTAAAIAYGLHKEEDQTILVVDLGGGTFDISLLELFDGIMQVEAISGDNQLGGEDFTQILVLDFLDKYELSSIEPREQSLLYKKMEQLKIKLSSSNQGNTSMEIGGKRYDYDITLSQYEELCQNLLKRMRSPMARVLNDGKITLNDISRVILVGGATKNPIVRNYFARLLRQLPYTLLEPDETVAYGVGIQASYRSGKILKEEMILTDVCGHSLGTEAVIETKNGFIDGCFSPIIERNTTIPVSKEETYYSVTAQQDHMKFSIYQGESPKAEENLKIGEVNIEIPVGQKGYPINCRFTYDTNGILEVIVTDPNTKKYQTVIIEENPGKLSPEQIKESLEKLNQLKIHPKDRAENRLIIARLERLYMEFTGEKRNEVRGMLLSFQDILGQQDEALTKKAVTEYSRLVRKLESELLL